MGLSSCKPENPYVRDRVRLCDGLKPLFGPMIAAGGNGRYVFILGDKTVRLMTRSTEVTSFKLDYIDLLRSVRTRVECVGGFFNFGILVGFYALNEHTVVLVDFNEAEMTMRQRLISIDAKGGRAYAWLDRGYRMTTRALYFIGRTSVSEDRAITMAPSIMGRVHPVAFVYPKNPLNNDITVLNISALLVEAGNRVRGNAQGEAVSLSAWDAPFFLSATKIGFFTDRSGLLTVDPAMIVICDVESGSISVERSKVDENTNFPYAKEGTHPFDCRSFSGSKDQLGLLVSHRCPANGWRRAVGGVTEKLASWAFYVFIVLAQNEWPWLSTKFLSLSIFLGMLKFRILRPPGARIGLMDTRTLQWRELTEAANPSQFASMRTSVFPDGHTLIYDRVIEKRAGARDIGRKDAEPTEEIRILSNPGRISSLKTLSEMQLRKKVMASTELEQICARI